MESLYRKYRPLTFESVVGQQHIVSTLEHAVTEGRLSHAYLFCGPRGTGKTTMARILAKALLCQKAAPAREQGASGCLPDGTCPECEQIAEGTHPDVYELDAASRTGVDNVREEIIGSVNFAPVRGAYKIYIIDEVHMLTTAAFNALLKTLEEPPSHVVFVMCTTDPQKIPETILSRCQRFDFHRIGNEDIVGRLRFICEQEGFAYDDEALEVVAKHARGGMRDALSTLEQLSVFGNGEVRIADARALLGEVAGSVLAEFARAIAARDVATLFALVRAQVDEGNDLMELTRDLVAHLRDVYMVRVAGARPEVVEATPEELAALTEEAGLFEGPDRLARTLTVLDDAALEMRAAADTRLVLEIALTRLARPKADLTLEALADRLDRIEAQLAAGVPSAPLDAAGAAAMMGLGAPSAARAAAEKPAAGGASPAARPSGGVESAARAEAGRSAGAVSRSEGSAAPERAAAPKKAAAAQPPVTTPTQAAALQGERHRGEVPPAPIAPTPAAGQGEAAGAARHGKGAGSVSAATEAAQAASASAASHAEAKPEVRTAPDAAPEPARAAGPQPAAADAGAEPQAAPVGSGAVTDPGELQRRWSDVVHRVTAAQPSRGALLQSSRARHDDGDTLTVGLPAGSGFAIKMLGREDSHAAVNPAVAAVFGPRKVVYTMGDGPAGGGASAPTTSAPETPAVASAPAAGDANHGTEQAMAAGPAPAHAGAAPAAAPTTPATVRPASAPVVSERAASAAPAPETPTPADAPAAPVSAPASNLVPAVESAPASAATPPAAEPADPSPASVASGPATSSDAPGAPETSASPAGTAAASGREAAPGMQASAASVEPISSAPEPAVSSSVSAPAEAPSPGFVPFAEASASGSAQPQASASAASSSASAPWNAGPAPVGESQADQSSGPTVLPDRDVAADRQAWEDEAVPYDDAFIASYEEAEDLPPFDMPDIPAVSAPATAPATQASASPAPVASAGTSSPAATSASAPVPAPTPESTPAPSATSAVPLSAPAPASAPSGFNAAAVFNHEAPPAEIPETAEDAARMLGDIFGSGVVIRQD